jgi:hypothetical protein
VDIGNNTKAAHKLLNTQMVTQEELETVIQRLPNSKVPGPDGIPNEILKTIAPLVSEDLAGAITQCFACRLLLVQYKESTMVTLHKEGKLDYFLLGSNRPIALENTLAKVVEKLLANQITQAAKTHLLLPWNQMGARKDRSTL